MDPIRYRNHHVHIHSQHTVPNSLSTTPSHPLPSRGDETPGVRVSQINRKRGKQHKKGDATVSVVRRLVNSRHKFPTRNVADLSRFSRSKAEDRLIKTSAVFMYMLGIKENDTVGFVKCVMLLCKHQGVLDSLRTFLIETDDAPMTPHFWLGLMYRMRISLSKLRELYRHYPQSVLQRKGTFMVCVCERIYIYIYICVCVCVCACERM